MKKIFTLIKRTFQEWGEDKAARLAAALAYYAVFSFAPILIIAITVASFFYDRQAVQGLVIDQIGGLAGEQGGTLISTMLDAGGDLGSSPLLVVVGVVSLIFGATGVFAQLQDALNTIWDVKAKPGRGIMGLIKDRFLSFTMVVSVGFLLLISLVISALLAGLEEWWTATLPGLDTAVIFINFFTSLAVITVLFALVFKYVPDVKVKWKDVWLGAVVTAVLFTIGKTLIGLYLGNSSVIEEFGGAGSLVLLLLWIYYSAQISFLGAEFTQVYANMHGSEVVPNENAVKLTEAERAKQGIPREAATEEAAKKQTREFPKFQEKASLPVTPLTRSEKTFFQLSAALLITIAGALLNPFKRKTG